MRGNGGPLPWLALFLALACGHTEEPADKGETATATTTCADYCDSVMSACVAENAVYTSNAACLAVCALLEPGDASDPGGNTLACRGAQAKLAEREPDMYCAAAGPGGNDSCGSDCEAYCALYSQVCPEEADAQGTENCLEQCAGLVDQPGFDVIADHQGDTIECRLVHLSSATLDPAVHCAHAQLSPTQPWCVVEP